MQKTVCQYLLPVLRNPWQKFYQLKKPTLVLNKVFGLFGPIELPLKLIFRKARAKQQRGENYKALDAEDEVRLYEDGWKDRYFRSKFDVSADDTEFRRKVVEKYTEGLCWVLSYYYQGQVLADYKQPDGPVTKAFCKTL